MFNNNDNKNTDYSYISYIYTHLHICMSITYEIKPYLSCRYIASGWWFGEHRVDPQIGASHGWRGPSNWLISLGITSDDYYSNWLYHQSTWYYPLLCQVHRLDLVKAKRIGLATTALPGLRVRLLLWSQRNWRNWLARPRRGGWRRSSRAFQLSRCWIWRSRWDHLRGGSINGAPNHPL